MTFERSNIHAMRGYVPGEQPEGANVIKLNTNENPYPAAAAVARALAAIKVDDLRRYPPPSALEFRRSAARLHAVSPDNIIPTNGGDELLRLAVTTFAGEGDTIGIAVPSYSLYPVLAEIQGSRLLSVPLLDDWQLPDDFAQRLNQSGARLAMLVNPHAPTGLLLPVERLAAIAREFTGVLLVDEAYVDFVDPQEEYNLVPLIGSLDNLLILRTLSKGYSLAGLRFGYGIGSATVISPMLGKTRDSYNTDYIAQKLATAALDSSGDAAITWQQVRQDRAILARELARLGLPCLPSQSNFLLAQVDRTRDAAAIYAGLKQAGILVRYFDQDRLRDKLRITVGTPEQNHRLLRHLEAILAS
ncbi:MAG: hypothetical protein RLZZ385_1074 [Pseudomonadota bacterium]|jgi:histidinol-phosphate aminotransferase